MDTVDYKFNIEVAFSVANIKDMLWAEKITMSCNDQEVAGVRGLPNWTSSL